MIMNLIAIGVVAGLAYTWGTRGFFSGLLHLICVVVAGAIALAFWEPVAHFIMKNSPRSGFLAPIESAAWALSLLVIFGVSLALLRTGMDKIAPANMILDKTSDFVGGLVCGALSGLITAGLLVIGANTLWMGESMFGYKRVNWNQATRSLESDSKLWVPVDDIVAGFYGRLSTTVLQPNPSRSLARLYPNLPDVGSTMRTSANGGDGRITIRPGDVRLLSWYTVGLDPEGRRIEGARTADLLKDRFNRADRQYTDRTGESLLRPDAFVAGFVVRFEAGAYERNSTQVAIRPEQVRLVATRGENSIELFPVAIITEVETREPGEMGDVTGSREAVRYLAGDEVFASIPGTPPAMGFEFILPAGYTPQGLFVRNLRLAVDRRSEPTRFGSAEDRQRAINTSAIFEGGRIEFDESQALTRDVRQETLRETGILISDRLPMGYMLMDGRTSSIRTDEDRRIIGGEQLFDPDSIKQRITERNLQVNQFRVSTGAQLVWITLKQGTNNDNLTARYDLREIEEAPRDQPIFLVDENGFAYDCIGFIMEERNSVRLRFTKDRPLSGMADVGQLSRNQPQQSAFLMFEVPVNARIVGMAIGDKMVLRFNPGFEARVRW